MIEDWANPDAPLYRTPLTPAEEKLHRARKILAGGGSLKEAAASIGVLASKLDRALWLDMMNRAGAGR